MFLDGGLVISHRCGDFSIDSSTGQVIAAAGVVPAGVVTEVSGGVSLVWTAGTGAILSAHALRLSGAVVEQARIRGGIADGSLRLRIEWLTADASVEDAEATQFQVARQFACE